MVNRDNLLLWGILTLALCLRLWGISFGLPYVGSYDDEPRLADSALNLLRQDRLDFSQWAIGNAQIYLQALIGRIVFAVQGVDAGEAPTYAEIVSVNKITAAAIDVPYPLPEFYFWGRASVAILGGFSVILLYLIGKEVKSSRVGLISAFFLASISLHAEHSHYLTRAVPGVFFLLLAFYIILRTYLRQNWWFYLVSLLLAYIAVYTKQNNLIILAPLSLALTMSVWYEFKHRPTLEVIKYIGLIGGVVVIIFTLSWVFFQFNIFTYGRSIFYRIFFHSFVFGGYQFGYSGDNTFRWIIERFFIDPRADWRLVAFLAIPGIWLAFRLRERGWLFLAILIPYLLMMSFFTVRFENWLMPIVPFLALLAALSLDWIYERIDQTAIIRQPYWLALFCLIVILIPFASIRTIATLNYYTSQPDVRQVAGQWLQVNLPHGSRVVVDSWGPYLDSPHLDVVYVGFIGDKDLQTYRDEQVDYLVVNSISLLRQVVVGQSDPKAGELVETRARSVEQIMKELPLEREFVGPAMLNPPVINVLIYRVR